MAINNKIVGGAFTDSAANPIANGFLIFQLSQDERSPTPGQVGAGLTIRANLDGTGNVPSTPATYLFANDSLSPANSFYTVWAYTANGVLVWGPQRQQILTNPSPYDVTAWVPNSINTGATTTLLPVIDVAGFFPGTMSNGQTLLHYEIRQACSIPLNLAGAKCVALTAATGSTVINILYNGAQIGTMTFAPSGTVATLALTPARTAAIGDYLDFVCPTADATLAGMAFTLVFTRLS